MILEDVSKAVRVVSGEEDHDFSSIYFSSNESLKNLFQRFSLKDKDVLCVLASSDQLFYSYLNGAKSVDTFDVNCLTKYYYYLRRWSILYNKEYYLPRNITSSYKSLYQLIEKVQCDGKMEEDALSFWKEFLLRVSPSQIERLFFRDGEHNKIKQLKQLKEMILQKPFTFYHMNLFDDIDCDKKYDVIITSNILEYGWNTTLLRKGKDNLKNLLRDEGQVISSHFVYTPVALHFMQELQVFEEDFDYHEFPGYQEPFQKKEYPLGYCYTKKKM